MKKRKKLTALGLALVMAAICLACGQTGSTGSSGTADAAAQTETAETESTAVEAAAVEAGEAENTTAEAAAAEAGQAENTAAEAAAAEAGQAENTTAEAAAAETEEAQTTEALAPGIYLNGKALTFAEEGDTYLDLLSVENGVTVTVVPDGEKEVLVNGEAVQDSVNLGINTITRDAVIEFEIKEGDSAEKHTVHLMPDTFKDYTVEGESATPGDYYLSTYDEKTDYIFKLNNKGELIFYKKTDGEALDFRKQYNSKGEVRYTYMPYLESSFKGIQGLNPGSVVIMDENYEEIEEVFYKGSDGEDIMIDPHGFIYLDDGHYILTSYKDIVCDDIPEELGAKDNSAYLAVLYVQEIKDGEVLWEFCSKDYPEFYYASSVVKWPTATEACNDYFHFNSMFIDKDGNLLMSGRNIDAIVKISRETGELIWILGGSQDMFGLTEDQLFSKQHSIIVTEDGSYMLFNNGNTEVEAGRSENSSVIRLRVDEENKKVTEFTKYEMPFYSNYMGSIRELDSEKGIYLYAVGGNFDKAPEYSMIEYSEETGNFLTFAFNEGARRLYCANKCE